MFQVCKPNPTLISGSIAWVVPTLAGWCGFKIQWSAFPWVRVAKKREEPPGGECLAELSTCSFIRADLLQDDRNSFCFPCKKGILFFYRLPHPHISLLLPTPKGFCFSEAELYENIPLHFLKVYQKIRHHICPRERSSILEGTYWCLCKVRHFIMHGQRDKCAAHMLNIISVNLPCNTVKSSNEIPAQYIC